GGVTPTPVFETGLFSRSSTSPQGGFLLYHLQTQTSLASRRILTIDQRQRTTVRFGNLPAEHKTDAGAAWLCGEKRHKQISGIGETGPFILNPNVDVSGSGRPSGHHLSVGLHRCVDGITD